MSTPTCPACKSKFSHSNALGACTRCGLPDEVRNLGPRAIAKWKRNPKGIVKQPSGVLLLDQRLDDLSKRQRKLARKSVHSQSRKRNKHGRQHA